MERASDKRVTNRARTSEHVLPSAFAKNRETHEHGVRNDIDHVGHLKRIGVELLQIACIVAAVMSFAEEGMTWLTVTCALAAALSSFMLVRVRRPQLPVDRRR